MAFTIERAEEVARLYFDEALNRGNLDVVDQILASNYELFVPPAHDRGRCTIFTRYAAGIVAVVSGALLALPAGAQQLDRNWVRECHDRAGLAGQAAVCEATTHRLGRPAGTLRIDGGSSGNVSVRRAADKEVQVTARVQAVAATSDRARQIADAVTVRLDHDDIGSDGPLTRTGEA
jgi:hypothetical protein